MRRETPSKTGLPESRLVFRSKRVWSGLFGFINCLDLGINLGLFGELGSSLPTLVLEFNPLSPLFRRMGAIIRTSETRKKRKKRPYTYHSTKHSEPLKRSVKKRNATIPLVYSRSNRVWYRPISIFRSPRSNIPLVYCFLPRCFAQVLLLVLVLGNCSVCSVCSVSDLYLLRKGMFHNANCNTAVLILGPQLRIHSSHWAQRWQICISAVSERTGRLDL